MVAAVLAGDRRSAARLISRAEAGDPSIEQDLRALYRAGGKARVIGITGPPGAGKSTLVDRLIEAFRVRRQSIAVLAVDPTSPLSGGAILGDRVRMLRHADDPGVLIRSMAARGALGGLSQATGDAVTVLDALGFETIIVETVGVGQSETEILSLADLVVLLQTAHGGDGVQAVKAGVLEVADILVVNKADSPGSDKTRRTLAEMVAHRTPTAEGWDTPVLATEAATGAGLDALVEAIDRFFACREAHPDGAAARRRRQMRGRVRTLAAAGLQRHLNGHAAPAIDAAIDAAIERRSDPHHVATLLCALTAQA